jgi:hypothetical protein
MRYIEPICRAASLPAATVCCPDTGEDVPTVVLTSKTTSWALTYDAPSVAQVESTKSVEARDRIGFM